jgi:hypothetical protein
VHLEPHGTDFKCFPYRHNFPLHVAYTTSQLDFAAAYLRAHPKTHLVTLQLGGNDLNLLLDACGYVQPATQQATVCVFQGLPALLHTVAANLQTIILRLRSAGGYHHQLVTVTYYATNYADPAQVAVIGTLDQVLAQTTLAAGGRVADGFSAFQRAAGPTGGDPCAAGLLVRLPTSPSTCNLHPSLTGQTVLAGAVLRALEYDDTDH